MGLHCSFLSRCTLSSSSSFARYAQALTKTKSVHLRFVCFALACCSPGIANRVNLPELLLSKGSGGAQVVQSLARVAFTVYTAGQLQDIVIHRVYGTVRHQLRRLLGEQQRSGSGRCSGSGSGSDDDCQASDAEAADDLHRCSRGMGATKRRRRGSVLTAGGSDDDSRSDEPDAAAGSLVLPVSEVAYLFALTSHQRLSLACVIIFERCCL